MGAYQNQVRHRVPNQQYRGQNWNAMNDYQKMNLPEATPGARMNNQRFGNWPDQRQ
jgi:asparagine N-glycosylation enzyme membrane subunit Stt3